MSTSKLEKVKMEEEVLLDLQDSLDPLDLRGVKVHVEVRDLQEKMESRGHLDHLVHIFCSYGFHYCCVYRYCWIRCVIYSLGEDNLSQHC